MSPIVLEIQIWASFDPIFIMMSEQGIRNGPEHNFKMLVSKMNG